MNKYIASVALALAAVSMTSCEDLDTEFKGRYVTTEAKEEVLKINPDMAQAGIAGMSAAVTQYNAFYSFHGDFGYPSVMLGTDLQGHDMVQVESGYNWFRYWEMFTSPTATGTPAGEAWYCMFSQIYTANAVCQTIADDTEDPDLQFYLAQAKGTRAFDYWVLAQLFQFNYKGHEDSPCVPIVTNDNAIEVEANGAPRATVAEVYDQILTDVNMAIDLLQKSGRQPSQMVSSKAKRFMSLATAYGLRARVYLTMHKYAEAAADAQAAISHFSGSPLALSVAGKPGFWSIDEANWMWGLPINSSDRVVTSGIVNWPSHMNTFAQGGYTSVGAWKQINVNLWNSIPKSDVRKGWFVDENLQSPNLDAQYQAFVDGQDTPVLPYTQVKFDGFGGTCTPTENANDIPLMRIEEMYYILAESQAMSGDVAGGVATLVDFEKNYRNPNYTCNATTAEDVQMEVYQKRRVELYGEGLSWFDIMRLDLPVDREDANWNASYSIYIPSEAQGLAAGSKKQDIRIYLLPQGEINGNKAITSKMNNEVGVAPDASWTSEGFK